MAKKLKTLMILGATVGAAAAGAYYYLKKQDEAFFDEDDDDEDFDNFEDETEERNYVQLTPGSEKTQDAETEEASAEEFFDADEEDDGDADITPIEEEE